MTIKKLFMVCFERFQGNIDSSTPHWTQLRAFCQSWAKGRGVANGSISIGKTGYFVAQYPPIPSIFPLFRGNDRSRGEQTLGFDTACHCMVYIAHKEIYPRTEGSSWRFYDWAYLNRSGQSLASASIKARPSSSISLPSSFQSCEPLLCHTSRKTLVSFAACGSIANNLPVPSSLCIKLIHFSRSLRFSAHYGVKSIDFTP